MPSTLTRAAARCRRVVGMATVAIVLGAGLGGCSDNASGSTDSTQVDATTPPELGACRMLTPADAAQPSNATSTVPCSQEHTAQTFAVGPLPERFDDVAYDDPGLGRFAYQTCSAKFRKFLGGDESAVLRTVVSWVWFRPSESAWDDGARWYRCDVAGGTAKSKDYLPLPTTAEGLLQGRPDDRWLACAEGPTVAGSTKVPCSQPHDWRAVTTIKVGEPEDPYPGDRVVEVTTRDYCSDSVGAWLNYPVDYDYGYTWFHKAEWEAGNRRSVCWAKTSD